MDIPTGLTAISTALEIFKGIKQIDKGIDQAEQKLQNAEFISALANAKLALVDAQEQALEKDGEIAKLKAHLDTRNKTVDFGGFMFDADEKGNATGYAYCPNCDVNEFKHIRLVDHYERFGNTCCPGCDKKYKSERTIIGYRGIDPSEAVTGTIPDFDLFER